MMGNDALVHDRVSVNSVRIIRPREAPQGALRDFEADIEGTAEADGEGSVIGGIRGCLGWWAWLPDLTDTSRTAGNIAETIAAAIEIGEMLPNEPESRIEGVLIIEHFWLEPRWRGNRLSSRIFDQLIDLLLLTPENTLVLTYLEPQPDPTPTLGAHQDTQLKLHAAFAEAGFQQWRQSDAWWMHPNSQSWQP